MNTTPRSVVLVLLALGSGCSKETPAPSPSAMPSPVMAHVRELQGSVHVKPYGILEWQQAEKAMSLRRGDNVKTDSESGVDIEFLDGLTVRLGAGSLTTIEGNSQREEKRADFKVFAGGVSYSKKAAGETTTRLKTEGIEWRGGDGASAGRLDVANNGDAEFQQHEGTGEIKTRKGETVAVGPKQGLRTAANGEVKARLVLPDVPRLLTPADQSKLTYAEPGATTTVLVWEAVPGVQGYHLMLDTEGWFSKPLLNKSGVKDTSLSALDLGEGKYYWKVAAVSKDGAEGAFSSFARFSVTKGEGLPLPLSLEPFTVRGAIVHVRGRTAPGSTVTANGQALDVQRDGSFDEYLTLQTGSQKVTITAKNRDGRQKTEERVVNVGPA